MSDDPKEQPAGGGKPDETHASGSFTGRGPGGRFRRERGPARPPQGGSPETPPPPPERKGSRPISEGDGHEASHRVQRASSFDPHSSTEMHQGAKPGSRFARLTRSRQKVFERGGGEGVLVATRLADRPRTIRDRLWRDFKRTLIGAPLSSARLHEEKLSKIKALPIFASDALSSTAYATEEILLVLVLAGSSALLGVSAFGLSIPISIAIAALLAIVATSYRQTIRAYPQGGGAYKVALENLGVAPGLIAGASLFVDYTLTVAVSTAAGVAAITSAFPELHEERVFIAVGFVSLLTVLNLRGLRESGTVFAFPTYFFLLALGSMIVTGIVRLAIGGLDSVPHEDAREIGTQSLTGVAGIFLVLRAFSSGATALTGVEAISNGVPSFKEPSPKNAAATLTWMAVLLATIFVSLTVLAHQIDVQPSHSKTVVAQIADAVFEGGPLFYIVQAATALILILAANTSFAGLPALASVMAQDRYAPKLFAFRGDRLGFSNGIMVLAVASALLLILYRANQHDLIPLYAVGVFIGFTLSQAGMVNHWRRSKEFGWKRAMMINATGATATGVVTVVIAATKFTHGAWLTLAAITVIAVIFHQIGRHYRSTETRLKVEADEFFTDLGSKRFGQAVVIPIDEINRATVLAASYARAISNNVTALHVTDDRAKGEALRQDWQRSVLDVPVIIVESQYRSLLGPVMAYVDQLDRADPGQVVTVVLPEYIAKWPWQRWLHNQSSKGLKKALIQRPHTILVEVPFHLEAPEPL